MNRKLKAKFVVCTLFLGAVSYGAYGKGWDEEPTYANRVLEREDVHHMDPNVWAYTPDFAKHFKMPENWITPDLKGAEAVAYRIVQDYPMCGWNGNRKACNDGKTCVMDVYFDNKKQKLPWDDSMRFTDLNIRAISTEFLSWVTPVARKREMDSFPKRPFKDPATGLELVWNIDLKNAGLAGVEGIILSYDREIFSGYSVVTMFTSCGEQVSIKLQRPGFNNKREKVNHSIVLPAYWQARTAEINREQNEKETQFFKQKFMELSKDRK